MIEAFHSRVNVPVSMVERDAEYLWDAIDRVIADARRVLLNAELVGGLGIVVRRETVIRPVYHVVLTCVVDRGLVRR
jgi:glycerol kinase